MWTRALADADASCGGKAHGLARLIAAGLRVPDGFVIDDRAFRVATGDAVRHAHDIHPSASLSGVALRNAVLEPDPGISLRLSAAPDDVGHTLEQLARQVEHAELPADLVDEIIDRARRLGGPFAVRSSATIEDSEAGAAAGVFSSRLAVPQGELWSAIRAVWLSALTPLAAAYGRRRGGETSINVIVQRSVAGTPVVAYTRPPGSPTTNEIWIQRQGELTRVPREAAPVLVDAERAIHAAGGADLELVVASPDGFAEPVPLDAWFVQARPIVHPAPHTLSPPPPALLASLGDGRRWRWDVAHNPDPLSPAQAGLVERVERAGAAPWSSKICAGYLYTSPNATGGNRLSPSRPESAAELSRVATQIEIRIAATLASTTPTLADALDRYVAFFRIWATELGPLIATCRGNRAAVPGDRPSAAEATLLAAARGELDEAAVVARLGVLAPAWDVAAPTFGEQPGLLRDAVGRARASLGIERPTAASPTDAAHAGVASSKSTDARPRERDRVVSTRRAVSTADLVGGTAEIANVAADLAEMDDVWFARAQWMVRSAILQRALDLGIDPNDAFWLPLDELALATTIDPTDASRRASGARAAAARAATWNMPISVGDSKSSSENPGVADPQPIDVLRGIGTGGRVTGRVRRFQSLASAIVVGHGDVVVVRAVTPALAVIVIGCAAIVSETGGVLDHGAAMARELGIPCIVGCKDAWLRLIDGAIVTIDGDQVIVAGE